MTSRASERQSLRRPLPLAYHPLYQPIRKGQTFAWPASLALRVRAGQEPVRIVRCLGPQEA